MIKYRNKFKEVDLNKSYKIIRKPIVTEKATKLSEFNKVVFEVASKSNKNEIKSAIEKLENQLSEAKENESKEKENALRHMAELENFRRRKQQEVDTFKKYASEQVIVEFLTHCFACKSPPATPYVSPLPAPFTFNAWPGVPMASLSSVLAPLTIKSPCVVVGDDACPFARYSQYVELALPPVDGTWLVDVATAI